MTRHKILKQWTIPARVTRSVTVLVEAASPEDAIEKFENGDWIEEHGSEILDWNATGQPEPE